MADKKRPRPDGDEGDTDLEPGSSKRGKNEDSQKREQDENLTRYISNSAKVAYEHMREADNPAIQWRKELRFPILPTAYNGRGISKILDLYPRPGVQMDAMLGLAGLSIGYHLSYKDSNDRFEEYMYRYPELNRAFVLDAQATAWIYYFNRAFKAHQDTYRNDPKHSHRFEFPCPSHYMSRAREWLQRVETVLQKHGDLSDAFPGYGYQNWPSTRSPSNAGVHVRYYGTPEEYKEAETQRKVAIWVLKNMVKQPQEFKPLSLGTRSPLLWIKQD